MAQWDWVSVSAVHEEDDDDDDDHDVVDGDDDDDDDDDDGRRDFDYGDNFCRRAWYGHEEQDLDDQAESKTRLAMAMVAWLLVMITMKEARTVTSRRLACGC